MRIRWSMLPVFAVAAVLAVPATSVANSASEHLVGVVQPTVGADVDTQGNFTGVGGTQPATVTREQRGQTVVVTVTPSF